MRARARWGNVGRHDVTGTAMQPARFLLAGLALAASTAAAPAQDRVIDAKPCSLWCKLQRNVTRNAAVSATAPLGGHPIATERAPAAAEGAGRPDPSEIFARRGEVMAESPAERARARRMKARMAHDIEAPGAEPAVRVPTAAPRAQTPANTP